MDRSSRFSDGFSAIGDEHRHGSAVRNGAVEAPDEKVVDSLRESTEAATNATADRAVDSRSESTTSRSDGAAAPGERSKWHDERGRFVKGNPGGPGNPYNRQVAATKREMANFMTPELAHEYCSILMDRMRKGDMAAARLLREVTMPNGIDPDTVHLHEWKLMQEEAKIIGPPEAPWSHLRQVQQTPDPEFVLETLRAVRPAATTTFARGLAAALAMGPENMQTVREMEPTEGLAIMNEVGGQTEKGKQWLKAQARRAKRRNR